MFRFRCLGIFGSTIAIQILFYRLLPESNDTSFVAQLSFFKPSAGKRHCTMKSIFSKDGNPMPHSESPADREKSEENTWNDHKSMVTLWLVLLFALWVVLTTALAVTTLHNTSKDTLEPPVIAGVSYGSTPNLQE